jgi:hypothetical protein
VFCGVAAGDGFCLVGGGAGLSAWFLHEWFFSLVSSRALSDDTWKLQQRADSIEEDLLGVLEIAKDHGGVEAQLARRERRCGMKNSI